MCYLPSFCTGLKEAEEMVCTAITGEPGTENLPQQTPPHWSPRMSRPHDPLDIYTASLTGELNKGTLFQKQGGRGREGKEKQRAGLFCVQMKKNNLQSKCSSHNTSQALLFEQNSTGKPVITEYIYACPDPKNIYLSIYRYRYVHCAFPRLLFNRK